MNTRLRRDEKKTNMSVGQNAYIFHIVLDKSVETDVKRATDFGRELVKASREKEGRRIGYAKLIDFREPPSIADITIHWSQPHGMWIPWSTMSVLYIDASIWSAEWIPIVSKAHILFFSTEDGDTTLNVPHDVKCFTMNQLLEQIHEEFLHVIPLPRHMPPLLNTNDCPPISIITLLHNRPKFAQNACFNLLTTDYPRDKIEWIVVDDSEPDQSASDRIVHFQQGFSPGTVIYIPLVRKTPIGKKRNIGIQRASHDILLMMDDDDHYPVTSFRRRVAWLLKDRVPHECAVCTTLAMYDLKKGLSAVNVPPLSLGLAKRCSEATLTFRRGFWKARPFSESVSISEGEGFLEGRESQVVEMPPQQIIVAFSHGSNISGRTIPESAGQGCFWGFEPSFLKFIHSLVGVVVEEIK